MGRYMDSDSYNIKGALEGLRHGPTNMTMTVPLEQDSFTVL
jgi:hypothetical protein